MADYQRAAQLGLERRFPEAAAESIAYAEVCRKRGNLADQFDGLAAAGKFYSLADMHAQAVRYLGEALDLLERDMALQPKAVLAVRRVSGWPELYSRAAFSSLALGDPLRAVGFAERGRARTMSHLLGPASASRPRTAPGDLWAKYVSRWRSAVAEAANDLVDADAATAAERRTRLRRLGDEIGDLRDDLESRGVSPDDLSPVGKPFDAATLPSALARASRSTVVLYSMRLNDVLRLVLIDSGGAREIAIDPADQKRILGACDARVDSLMPPNPELNQEQQAAGVRSLIAAAGPPVGEACVQAVDGLIRPRLVWIAHASLIALPLAACPAAGGFVADIACVVAAPSLTLAAGILSKDRSSPARASAVVGRAKPGQPPATGAGAVARVLDPAAGAECFPRTTNELQVGAKGAALHLSCHGLYNWKDPLRSALQLGDGLDLPLGSLFDGTIDLSGKLVLLGACDSASVAQGLTNESVGMPTAMLAAGAHAVVGAGWPVARIAAVAFCLRFMHELRDGLASPEAARAAARWVRAATYNQVHELAIEASHPIVDEIRPAIENGAGDETACDEPVAWAAFSHWGGGWVVEKGGPTSPRS